MFSHVRSSTTIGVEALPVQVEAHLRTGLPKFNVVGLPDGAVKESRERIFSALVCNNLPVPRGIVTINLAPADIRKEGAAFDLPMAVAIVAAQIADLEPLDLTPFNIVGELSLDGHVRPVRGALAMAMQARDDGIKRMIVPRSNASEAATISELKVYGVSHIKQALEIVATPDRFVASTASRNPPPQNSKTSGLDFSEVKGQAFVKRALEVAAAGAHNAIMIGPPGSGKTMLARRLPSILPAMSTEEMLEATCIASIGGILPHGIGLVTERPFRSPHHSVSDAGLCGGGANPRPGEISLAHNGVLFLDELPEFKRQVLEVLRQPLEEGAITISRAQMSVRYPARFMLIAGMNPCPCGNRSNPQRPCICKPDQVQRYLSRISGPLLDRIDIHVEVTPVPFEAMNDKTPAESSDHVRNRVNRARQRQRDRFADVAGCADNANMGGRLIRKYCTITKESRDLLKAAVDKLGLSARAYHRILKVARTIADLDEADNIQSRHLAEAIQYRSLDRKLADMIA